MPTAVIVTVGMGIPVSNNTHNVPRNPIIHSNIQSKVVYGTGIHFIVIPILRSR